MVSSTRLLEELNDTARAFPRDICIHERFAMQVERTPDAIAVVAGDGALTYRELDTRADRLARALAALGVGSAPDARVGLFVERSLEMMIAVLAVLKAGAAYVPLDPEYPPLRLDYMVQDARVAALLVQPKLRRLLPPAATASGGPPILELDGASLRAMPAHAGALRRAMPDDIAYVIYTSGSTGRPKGVMCPHIGLVNRLCWMQDRYRLTAADTVLQKTPFSFDVSVWELLWPLCEGARLVMAPPGAHRDASQLAKLIRREAVTVIHFVPSMLGQFLMEPSASDCPTLRHVICSGEALPAPLRDAALKALPGELHNLYGPTEASIDVTSWKCESTIPEVPIGRPIDNTQVYILDGSFQEVPIGTEGELYLGGVGLARGYLGRADLTAERFIPNPFARARDGELALGERMYRTGDRAQHLPDGNVVYLGRVDHQVKIRGLRIELGEIEAALGAHPAVAAVVVVVRDEDMLVAYWVPRASNSARQPASDELRAYLRDRLPEFMVPTIFMALKRMPLSPNGKIDRGKLPAPEEKRARAQTTRIAPRDALESHLHDLWKASLEIDGFGVTESYFALGGTSLRATMLKARIEREIGKRLPGTALVTAVTIADLANLIRYAGEDDGSVIRLASGSLVPFFCVTGVGGGAMRHIEIARRLGEADQPYYALVPPPRTGKDAWGTIEELAAHYLRQLRLVQPTGPYALGGYSFGATVAFEMASQLCANHEQVSLLALLDPKAPIPRDPDVRRAFRGSRMERLSSWINNEARLLDRYFKARDVYHIWKAHDAAFAKYRAARYPGHIALFVSQAQRARQEAIWSKLAAGIETFAVPIDDHLRFLHDPATAELLRLALDSVRKVPSHAPASLPLSGRAHVSSESASQ